MRFADDFVILWNDTHQGALALRDELKQFLWDELRLELSEEKTRVTHLTDGRDFLGYHLQWELPTDGHKPWLRVTPTKENLQRFRAKIKALTKRNTTFSTPEMRFKALNRVIRGWGHYYRHVSFSHDAGELDYWLNRRVLIWLENKHDGKGVRWLLRQYRKREVTTRHNRWNFAAECSDGELIFIARLRDIRLTAYHRKQPPHPYANASQILILEEPAGPFADPGVINISPDSVVWKEKRGKALKRDGYRCVQCGRSRVRLEVHHAIARQHGGTNDLDNLVTLCADCHHDTPTYGRRRRNDCPMESRMT